MKRFLPALLVASVSLPAFAQTPKPASASAPVAAAPGAAAPPTEAAPLVATVTASRRVAGSDTVIGEKDLQRFEHDDPHRILLSVPGVYIRQEDGFGLRPNIGLRGANAERSKKVTLTEDGILFGPAPYSAPAAYYFPLMTRMIAVRVVKGPGAITMGPQTIGGAVDLRTRGIPSDPSGAVDLAVGSYLYRKLHAHAGFSTEQWGVLVEGVHLGSDGFKELDGGGNTGFTRNEWMLKARYTIDPTARVQQDIDLKLGYSDELSNETYLGLTDDDFRASPYRRYAASELGLMEWHRTQFVVGHTVRFERLTLRTQVYRHDLTRSWNKLNGLGTLATPREPGGILANPTGFQDLVDVIRGERDSEASEQLLVGPNQRDFISQGIQTTARWRVRTGPITHTVKYGLRAHHDQIERAHTEQAYLMRSGELVPAQTPNPVQTTRRNRDSTLAAALWIRDEMLFGPLALSPGIRAEVIHWRSQDLAGDPSTPSPGADGVLTSDAYAIVAPGIGAYYAFTPRLGALAGVHRGFSPVVPGTVGGSAETSTNYEAGLRYVRRPSKNGWADRTRAEVLGFFNDYDNLTFVCGFSAGCAAGEVDSQFDAGRAHVYGLEAQLKSRLRVAPDWRLPVGATYTYTRAVFRNAFQSDNPQWGDVEEGDAMPYVPEHQLAANLGVEHRRFRVDAGLTYVAPMREQAGQEPLAEAVTTDGYAIVDLSAAFQITREASIYTNLRNALGNDYIASRRPFGARPGMPRSIDVGVKARF